MICKNCSSENPENAVFCGKCGKRLDGNVVCPHCGKLVPDENNFCFSCGARLKGTPQAIAAQPAPVATVRPAAPAKQRTGAWKKILEIVGGAVGMAGVFFALLFTFLIGFSSNVSSLGEEIEFVGHSDIYYYFGDAYEQIAEVLNGMTSYSAFYEFNIYLVAIINTVIAAATIITVVTLSIITLVRYLRKLLKKSEKDYAPTLIGAILTYILGASLFLGVHNFSISADISAGVSVSAGVYYNTATAAGIAVSILFLCGFLGCRAAQFGKKLGKPAYLFRVIFSGVGIVLVGIVWSMTVSPIFSFTEDISITSRMSASLYLQTLAGDYVSITSEPDVALYVSVLLTLVLQIALAILSALLAVKLMKNLACEKCSARLGLGIAETAVALALMIAALVACSLYIQAAGYSEASYSTQTAFSPASVVAFVFSVLLLGTTIAHKILKKKFDRAPSDTQQPVYTAQPVQQPVPEQSAANEPVTNEPVTNEPAANEPVTNEPVTNEPSESK